MTYLLHTERHKYRKAFRGESSANGELCTAVRQTGLESFKLLPTQYCYRAKVLSRTLLNTLGIRVKLRLGFCRVNDSDECRNYTLISCNEVVKKFLALLLLLLHFVGNGSGKVVVLVLLLLPIRDIGFHRKELVLTLLDSLINGYRLCVDRQHHIAVDCRQFRHEAIADKVSVIFEIDHSAKPSVHLEIVALELHTLGSKCELKAMLAALIKQAVVKIIVLASAMEEIEENANLLFFVHLGKS